MKSKIFYDFVLWAIPRFHRADAEQKQQQPYIAYFLDTRSGQTPSNPALENSVRTITPSADNSEQAAHPYTRH
jgi:hypothetical protein